MIPQGIYPILTLIFGFFLGYRFRKYIEKDEKLKKEIENVSNN